MQSHINKRISHDAQQSEVISISREWAKGEGPADTTNTHIRDKGYRPSQWHIEWEIQ